VKDLVQNKGGKFGKGKVELKPEISLPYKDFLNKDLLMLRMYILNEKKKR